MVDPASSGSTSSPAPSQSAEGRTRPLATSFAQLDFAKLGARWTGHGEPTVLVACGSFSPITNMHLRLFEMARDQLRVAHPEREVFAGIVSPVHDGYAKRYLLPAGDRIVMSQGAVASSRWIVVDPWEATQPVYSLTAPVLKHVEDEFNSVLSKPVRVMLLSGADLLDSFHRTGLWAPEHMERILSHHGVAVVERFGSSLSAMVQSSPILSPHAKTITLVPQPFINDISSTQVRAALWANRSIRYLVPDFVADYVEEHRLFPPHQTPPPHP